MRVGINMPGNKKKKARKRKKMEKVQQKTVEQKQGFRIPSLPVDQKQGFRIPSLPPFRGIEFCFPDGCLSETRMVKDAKTIENNLPIGWIFLHNFEGRPVSEFLLAHFSDESGCKVHLDCCLAIQVVLHEVGLMPRSGLFCIGSLVWNFFETAQHYARISGDNTYNPGYWCPKDKEHAKRLQIAGGSAQGQWLLGPNKDGLYLGMTFDSGLQKQTIEWWHQCHAHRLQSEATSFLRKLESEADPNMYHMVVCQWILCDREPAIANYTLHRQQVLSSKE